MYDTTAIVVSLSFSAAWVVAALAIVVAGRQSARARAFRGAMARVWKPALAIAAIYWLGLGFGGLGFVNWTVAGVFSQAVIGLALARSIGGFEPLPIARSLLERDLAPRSAAGALVVALALIPLPIVVSMVGTAVGHVAIREPVLTGVSLPAEFPHDPPRVFLVMLAGAGIAEETIFRLAIMSALWKWSGRLWPSILLSAVVFGFYHLSPLDTLYTSYWHAPTTQLVTSTTGGIVMGLVYARWGYETAVLGHTLGNTLLFSLMVNRAGS